MERGPVRQQEGLVALAVVGLEVAAAGLAVVDAQAGFALDGHGRQPLGVAFTERAAGSLVLPACAATAAGEKTSAAGVRSDQLSHGGCGSAGRAVVAKPALVVSPAGERLHDRRQIACHHGPSEVSQQAGGRRRDRIVAEQPGHDAARDIGLAPQVRVQRRGFLRQASGQRLEPPASRRGRRSISPRARGPVPRWSSAGAARPLENRRRSRPSREWPQCRSRDRPPRDRPARKSARPAGGRNARPASRPRSSTQWLSLVSCRGRTGNSRAPRPNRKIVAAIRPIEMPHSKIDGA